MELFLKGGQSCSQAGLLCPFAFIPRSDFFSSSSVLLCLAEAVRTGGAARRAFSGPAYYEQPRCSPVTRPSGFLRQPGAAETHFPQHKRRQQRAHSEAHCEAERVLCSGPECPASRRLCYRPLRQRHPRTGEGCRNRKPLTETLL